MKFEPEIDAMTSLPETSVFLKAVLKMAMAQNPTDAARDTRIASEVLERRAERLQREPGNDNHG
ncbi:MAG: hypothetical protein M9924_21740 [Rhizobiaceae bacterium]|nr:hypothetical protein [Rhizobiaceae bacterium]